ncbi:DUF6746 family protein [Colwellia sp. E150_009]
MRKLVLSLLIFMFVLPVQAINDLKEKPVQHLKVADLSSMEAAKNVFINSTAKIKSKNKLNVLELEQIHIITYSLEKSVAYFVKNLRGERQSLAKEIAITVENIHINAENNRPKITKEHIDKYFNLADKFIADF